MTIVAWILITVLVDLVVFGIRWTVFTFFSDVPVIKKYIVEPTDEMIYYVFDTADKLSYEKEQGSTQAGKDLKILTAWLIVTYVWTYLVPFASIPMLLVLDPILCILLAKGKIRYN